jgi:hypothetical protein
VIIVRGIIVIPPIVQRADADDRRRCAIPSSLDDRDFGFDEARHDQGLAVGRDPAFHRADLSGAPDAFHDGDVPEPAAEALVQVARADEVGGRGRADHQEIGSLARDDVQDFSGHLLHAQGLGLKPLEVQDLGQHVSGQFIRAGSGRQAKNPGLFRPPAARVAVEGRPR